MHENEQHRPGLDALVSDAGRRATSSSVRMEITIRPVSAARRKNSLADSSLRFTRARKVRYSLSDILVFTILLRTLRGFAGGETAGAAISVYSMGGAIFSRLGG